MSAAPARLEVEGLSKRFGGLTAVRDISFSVKAGEILGLIGPNGSGKSTVIEGFDFITVDFPDPLGPIRPRISPALTEKLICLSGGQSAEPLGEAFDLKPGRRRAHAASPHAPSREIPDGRSISRRNTAPAAPPRMVRRPPGPRRRSPARRP